MGDAEFAEGIALGNIGNIIHLLVGGIAWGAANRFQRNGDRGVAGFAMRIDVVIEPAAVSRVDDRFIGDIDLGRGLGLERGRREIGGDAVHLFGRQGEHPTAHFGELGFNLPLDGLKTFFVHEDLDARLVLVVAAAIAVVHAHDRLEVGQEVLIGHKAIDQLADHRRTTEASADPDFPADFARAIGGRLQANVVETNGGSVVGRARDSDLELTR